MDLLKLLRVHKNSETLNKPGFQPATKLLVVHADDFGLCKSVNEACISALEMGVVSSGSIMVPCWGAEDAIAFSALHPEFDIGIHLTLTCEWDSQRWGPLLGNQVPSLTDRNGFFYENCRELEKNARLDEVESELHTQIKKVISSGMKPSHLDSHMFCCLVNPYFLNICLKLGHEYQIPVLLNREKIRKWFGYNMDLYIGKRDIVVDDLFIARQRHLKKGLHGFYRKTLENLSPGLSVILIHPGKNDQELRNMTLAKRNFNAEWRQADFDFFTGNECFQIIRDKNIRLTTWKEIVHLLRDSF